MFALMLALTVATWAQTSIQITPATPQQSRLPADKALCDKMSAGNSKDAHSCCANKDATADSKDAMPCVKNEMDKTAALCCKDGCGKDNCAKEKTAAACCNGKCAKDGEKSCCSGMKSEKTAKSCCTKEMHS